MIISQFHHAYNIFSFIFFLHSPLTPLISNLSPVSCFNNLSSPICASHILMGEGPYTESIHLRSYSKTIYCPSSRNYLVAIVPQLVLVGSLSHSFRFIDSLPSIVIVCIYAYIQIYLYVQLFPKCDLLSPYNVNLGIFLGMTFVTDN